MVSSCKVHWFHQALFVLLTCWAVVLGSGGVANGQDPGSADGEGGVEVDYEELISSGLGIDWEVGPGKSKIGSRALIDVPAGFRYTGKQGTHTLLKLFDNLPGESEIGLLSADGSTDWFVVFSFDDIGYVKDDEKDSIDKEALLEQFREGSRISNEQRAAAGMEELRFVGWAVEPYYNEESNSLEWGLKYDTDSGQVVNYFTKRLGRRGVMDCNLVVAPEELDAVLPQVRSALTGFEFAAGEKYSEFQAGDRIAEYGLTALVAGGALAVAAKSGLLGKLWKVVVFGVLAVGAFLKKLFTGGGSQSESV